MRVPRLRSIPGPVDMIALQREWAMQLREVSARHSCTALKLLGDGCMAAFEDPLDAYAFAPRSQRCSRQAGLQVRISMDAGRVEDHRR